MLYLAYIFSFGTFFLFKYLQEEKTVKNYKEVAFLILFPMAGYGNWIYNKEKRVSDTKILPRNWYIWRKMIYQNFILIILIAVLMVFFLVRNLYENIGGSFQFESGTFTILENNIDPTLGIGFFFSLIIGLIFILTLLFSLVFLPFLIARFIKSNHAKSH